MKGIARWRRVALAAVVAGGGAVGWAVVTTEPAADEPAERREARVVEAPALATTARAPSASPAGRPRGGGEGSIHGRVVRDGAPVAASVGAWSCGERLVGDFGDDAGHAVLCGRAPDAETRSGPDGEFRLDGLSPGPWRLVAKEEGRPAGVASRTLGAGAPRERVEIAIPGGSERLVVRAVRADGSPFLGWVDVHEPGTAVAPEGTSTLPRRTDATGVAEVDGLWPGVVVVRAFAPGDVAAVRDGVRVPSGGEVRVVVGAGTRVVLGRVLDDARRGIPGASVSTGAEDGGDPFHAAVAAGASGEFRIAVPIADARLRASAPGFAPASVPVGSPSEGLEIVLPRTGGVRGRVVDARTGSPVAGVPVHASPGSGRSFSPPAVSTRSGADGSFALAGVPPGRAMVFAFGEGFSSDRLAAVDGGGWNPFVVEVLPGAEASTTVAVVRAGRMRGRVVREDGSAVADATVDVAETGETLGGCCVHMDDQGYEFRLPRYGFLPPAPTLRSDERGGFRAATLLPGVEHTARATAPDGAHGREEATPAVDEEVEAVVTLGSGAASRTVEVRVVDGRDRRPVAGALVEGTTRTDADGRARVELGPSRGWVHVRADGYLDESVDARPVGDESADGPVVAALSPAQWIRVLVVGPDGAPREDAALGLRASDDDSPYDSLDVERLRDEDGSTRLGPVAVGSYRVTARVSDGLDVLVASETVEAGTGALLRLALAPDSETSRIRVALRDEHGVAVARALVVVRWREGAMLRSRDAHAEDGRAVVERPGQPFVVEASSPRDAAGLPLPLGAAVVGPLPATGDGEVVVVLPRSRAIEGRVVDPKGNPAAGVLVTAAVADPAWVADGSGAAHASAHAGADGRFALRSLGDAQYALDAHVPPGFLPVEGLRARPGDVVTISLRAAATARVSVVEASGVPVEGAALVLRDEEVEWLFPGMADAYTGPDGRAVIEGLDPEKPRVLTVFAGGRRTSRAGFVPGDVAVRMDPVGALSGTVRDADGRPVAGAGVSVRAGATSAYAASDADGRFTAGPLQNGAGEATVTFGLVGAQAFPVVVPGETALVVDRGGTVEVAFPAALREPATWSLASLGAGARSLQGSFAPGAPARVEGLAPGETYALYVRAGSLVGYRTAFRGDVGRLEVALVPERRVSGRVLLPKDVVSSYMRVEVAGPAFRSDAKADLEGRYEVGGLPDGTFRVEATVEHQGRWLHATAQARSGTTLDLEPR